MYPYRGPTEAVYETLSFQVNLNRSARGFTEQLSPAGIGVVFSGYAAFFQVNLNRSASGSAPVIIFGPIWGRFFQVTGHFFQVTAAR